MRSLSLVCVVCLFGCATYVDKQPETTSPRPEWQLRFEHAPLSYQVEARGTYRREGPRSPALISTLTLSYVLSQEVMDAQSPEILSYDYKTLGLDLRTVNAAGEELLNTRTAVGITNPESLLGAMRLNGRARVRSSARGLAEVIDGDPNPVETLEDRLHGSGPLMLVLPEHPVRIGDSWEIGCRVQAVGEMELRATPPIDGVIRFFFVGMEERDGRSFALIAMRSTQRVKEISVVSDAGGGPQVRLLDALTRHSSAEFVFDVTNGLLESSTGWTTLDAALETPANSDAIASAVATMRWRLTRAQPALDVPDS